VAGNGLDGEAGGPEARDVPFARPDDLGRQVLEDVEIARVTRRIVGRVQQHPAGEVALLGSIGRQHG
jgi:hypothetical protein